MKSVGGATLTLQADGSILAGGTNPPNDVYTIVADTDLVRITGLKLEALPDARFPARGPGRSPSGNFHLGELQLTAQPRKDAAAKHVPVALTHAIADFEQPIQGGGFWVRNVIDGNLQSPWGIVPRTRQPHWAIFEPHEPIAHAQGARLTITLHFQDPPGNRPPWVASACRSRAPPRRS